MSARRVTALAAACCILFAACGQGRADPPTARTSPHKPRPSRWESSPARELHAASIAHAQRIIARHVDVPVIIPSPLGAATVHQPRSIFLMKEEGEWSGSLYLDVPGPGSLQIAWGSAGFDGCGGDTAKPVRVAGERGLILVHRYKRSVQSQIIWPATMRTLEGTYGIYASVGRRRIATLAESMTPPRVAGAGLSAGC